MEKGRRFFYLLRMAAEAHARWEIESANDILRNRKKLLILLALSLPALGFVGYSFAAGTDFLGGKEAYAPSFYSNFIFFVSIFIGLCAGLITGCIGAGGGFVITPALMSAGVKGILAVGTDLFEVMISGLYGTATYTYKGRTELMAALIMLVGAAIGAQVGTVATKYIKGYGIRIAFGLCVVGCALSIVLKMLAKGIPEYGAIFDGSATVLILGLVAAMSLYIFVRMMQGAKQEVAMKKAQM